MCAQCVASALPSPFFVSVFPLILLCSKFNVLPCESTLTPHLYLFSQRCVKLLPRERDPSLLFSSACAVSRVRRPMGSGRSGLARVFSGSPHLFELDCLAVAARSTNQRHKNSRPTAAVVFGVKYSRTLSGLQHGPCPCVPALLSLSTVVLRHGALVFLRSPAGVVCRPGGSRPLHKLI